MGNGSSCGTRCMVTGKLILLDGELKEFSSPVKVDRLLEKNSDCFICNSDEMDFDELVTAMNGDEELIPGQLYFELPLSWLTQRRLHAEDMVSLAVKATAALKMIRSHDEMKCGCFGAKSVDPGFVVYTEDDNFKVKQSSRPLILKSSNELLVSVKKKGGVGKFASGGFTAKLSVIHEEEY